MVNQISGLLPGTNTLQETLQQIQAGQEPLPDQQPDLATADLPATADTLTLSQGAKNRSGNMMSRNFAGGRESDTKYVDAHLAGLNAAKQIENQATSRVAGLLSSLGGIKIGEGSDHTPAWFQMQMRRIQNAESSEASEKNLDEIQKSIERKAQEAVAATDADGKPIEQVGSAAEAAPMPEISGSDPASAAGIAPTPATPAVSASAPDVVASTSMQSVDVTV